MDVCTTPEMAPRGRCFKMRARRPRSRKRSFSQADIDEKVKLAFEKKAAEDAKKAVEEKNELLQQAVDAAVHA